MAGSLASINIKFAADLKGFSTQMQNAQRDIAKMGKDMQNVGAKMSLAFTAPLALLGNQSLSLFDTQAKAIAQVEAGLKSTGNAAGFTSKQLQDMASELQNNSLFGDEAILKDVTAQLLTFTNIADDSFSRTQQAALDLATRLDGDLKSASIQLGKALNDPKANLSALSRSGIQFSEDQKKVINALQESGKLAEAQTIILDELEKQYGGSAAAAAQAGTGGITQLKNSWGDLLEMFGEIINEALKPMISYFKDWVTSLQGMSAETKKMVLIVAGLVAAIGPLTVIIGTVLTLVPQMISGFNAIKGAFSSLISVMAANPITAIAVAIGLVVAGIYAYTEATDGAINVTKLYNDVRETAAKSVAKEKAELDTLLKIAKDETLSKQQRQNAIDKLNKISPEYLGNLRLETINTTEAKKAIDAYNVALNQRALQQAVLSKKTELYNKLIELQNKDLNFTGNAFSDAAQKASNYIFSLFGVETQTIKNRAELEKYIKSSKLEGEAAKAVRSSYEILIKEREKDVKIIDDQIKALDSFNVVLGNSSIETKKLDDETKDLDKTLEKLPKAGTIAYFERKISLLQNEQKETALTATEYFKLQNQINDYLKEIDKIALKEIEPIKIEQMSLQPLDTEAWLQSWAQAQSITVSGVNGISAEQMRMDEINKQFGESMTSIMEGVAENMAVGLGNLLGALATGAPVIQSIYSFLMGNISMLMEQLGKAAIQIGVTMQAIKSSFSTPFAAIAAGVALIALSTLVKSLVPQELSGGTPAFANGGVVPGTSLYGDKILARVNSGELILNQKQQANLWGMMNSAGEGVNVNLEGGFKLAGSDLELVIERAINKNNRKR